MKRFTLIAALSTILVLACTLGSSVGASPPGNLSKISYVHSDASVVLAPVAVTVLAPSYVLANNQRSLDVADIATLKAFAARSVTRLGVNQRSLAGALFLPDKVGWQS